MCTGTTPVVGTRNVRPSCSTTRAAVRVRRWWSDLARRGEPGRGLITQDGDRVALTAAIPDLVFVEG